MSEPEDQTSSDAVMVVVGCDGTDACQGAMRFAIEEAARRGCGLRIVIAFERPIDPDIDDFDIPEAELQRRAWASAQQCLTLALAGTASPAPANHDILTVDDRAATGLTDAAGNAGVIVIGGHHSGALERALFGSTTRDLLKHATVPVIIGPEQLTE